MSVRFGWGCTVSNAWVEKQQYALRDELGMADLVWAVEKEFGVKGIRHGARWSCETGPGRTCFYLKEDVWYEMCLYCKEPMDRG